MQSDFQYFLRYQRKTKYIFSIPIEFNSLFKESVIIVIEFIQFIGLEYFRVPKKWFKLDYQG